MSIESCAEKINKYFKTQTAKALLVNVQNTNDMQELINYFNVEGNKIICTSSFCHNDHLPNFEKILDRISCEKSNCFLSELTSFFRFYGEEKIKKILKNVLEVTFQGHVVILTYQCEKQLEEIISADPRISGRIYLVNGEKSRLPELVFVSDNISETVLKDEFILDGIDKVAHEIENHDTPTIYVRTAKSVDKFYDSLYSISTINSAYKILLKKISFVVPIEENMGTKSNWEYLLSLATKLNADFSEICNNEFGNYQCLEAFLPNYFNYSENQKWLYFIALKNFYLKDDYFKEVISHTATYDRFIKNIFSYILNFEPNNKDFPSFYKQRKTLLNSLDNPKDEVMEFCGSVRHKEENAIYYLTDNTRLEKELIFELIEKYFQNCSKSELERITSVIYPDLYKYLCDYNFDIPLLREYFSLYKYSKVVNKVSPELEKIVEAQSVQRDYNRYIEPRTSKIDKLDTENSQIYFVDAMGVEYLSYILAKCNENNLMAKITLCCANLPSITSQNKEFVDYFEAKGLTVNKIKELDDIKHNGINNCNYTETKLPIHLIRELEIIDEILENIKSKLAKGICEKSVIISDHGASRMAVIREKENMWEMSSKGKHSGRCCPKSDADNICSDFITEENGFWVIANYDRFKGSRKANVEVHGGATLEEIVVPIIEITNMNNNIEISIAHKEITVSFRKKAEIKLYSNTKLKDVKVSVEGKYYEATMQDNNTYIVRMPDLNKAKSYCMNVYSFNNLIAENLEFTIKKESSQEKDLF